MDHSLYIDSLSYSRNGRAILSGVYFELPENSIVGILGRNGSGKSTLMNCIFGNSRPDFAYMRCNGKVFKRGYHTGEISYLPQHGFVPNNLSVRQCVDLLAIQKTPIIEMLNLESFPLDCPN